MTKLSKTDDKKTIEGAPIIRYFKKTEFDLIPRPTGMAGALMDLVTVDTLANHDLEILEAWERHLNEIGTPFAVTRQGSVSKLWKERRE